MRSAEASENSRALGKAITIRRVELGLSRNDLRDRSGLSYPYVAELERGLKNPSSKALDAIARALEMRPHELLARAEQLMEERATPLMAPPRPAARPAAARPPAAGAPPAPRRASRWFGPAGSPSSPESGTTPAPSPVSPPAPARRLRRASAAPPEALTEERVREIVREELRRLVTEQPD